METAVNEEPIETRRCCVEWVMINLVDAAGSSADAPISPRTFDEKRCIVFEVKTLDDVKQRFAVTKDQATILKDGIIRMLEIWDQGTWMLTPEEDAWAAANDGIGPKPD
jgi:hypothetical protein